MSTKQISKEKVSTEHEREPENVSTESEDITLIQALGITLVFAFLFIGVPALIIGTVLWIILNHPFTVIIVYLLTYLLFKPPINMLKGDSQ